MRPRFAALLFTIGLLAAASAPAAAEQAPTHRSFGRLFLWKATSKTITVYLLGSIHVASKDFYPLADEIEKAFEGSKTLVVEVNLKKVDQDAMQEVMLGKGMYDDGDTVARHVPKDTLQKLTAYFNAHGLPGMAMERFRPWALSVTITQLEMQALGFSSELGIDKHFMDNAAGRPIVELESADEQIELLSGLPDKQDAEFLASTLDSASKTKSLIAKTVALWKSGDAAGLEKLLVTDPLKERPGLRPVFAKLFDERNAKMAAKMAALPKAKEPYFAVVGAGHLIGNKGIVKLLEKKGFHVEQITGADKRGGAPGDTAAAETEQKPKQRGYAPSGAWEK